MTLETTIERRADSFRPPTFADWRSRLDRERTSPIVAVAGSRGKTSVLRAVESILRESNLRFASWTDRGVEIEGEGQHGELGPWQRALTRLNAGGLDIALQEIDWATIQTIGAPGSAYPVIAVSNLCGNSDACLATPETLLARKALNRIKSSVTGDGKVILNANDFEVADDMGDVTADRYLVGVSADVPVLRRHLERGGDACWVDSSVIVVHEDGVLHHVVDCGDLPWVHDGDIPFAVQNALIATAIARACGIAMADIAAGLAHHVARPESMPGSFNVFETGSSTIVIDQPVPSWFLRSSLRATANLGMGRHVCVVGPMTNVPLDDLAEVGRLIGRNSAVVVVHGDWDSERMSLFRQGAASTDVPPIFVQSVDERRAIQQGIGMVGREDVLLVLAEDAPAAVRLVSNRVRRQARADRAAVGAA